jgi:alpha,alpha-trehalose phosphorylase
VPIRITKFMTYHSSRNVPPAELVDRAWRTLDRAMTEGYGALEAAQRDHPDDFWARRRPGRGPARVQQAIRWNIFQLAQASARAETTGIPAKGLTGQAYEGHYFWDTEIYVAPFLTYTDPRVTRNLLRFRHSMLPLARERARELSEDGALFPWRTINGEEASSYYAAGTAQYHIDADIAYAIKRYVDVRGERTCSRRSGRRSWSRPPGCGRARVLQPRHRGLPHPRGDRPRRVHHGGQRQRLHQPHGPLQPALRRRGVLWLREEDPRPTRRLEHTTGLTDRGGDPGQQAADAMYIPYDAERGIHPQDANFLEKERWDFANTPEDRYPLLLHYHPLVIYRHQVIKQADVVLAMVLLGNEFSGAEAAQLRLLRPADHRDSSLSACVQSILAAEIGYERKALEYFQYALLMDLADVAGNVVDGVHVASVGGVWMALVYGFGGLRDFDGSCRSTPAATTPGTGSPSTCASTTGS